MAIAIDRELAGDINNPSFDVINYCIEEHEKEIPRLEMLFDYYEGNPHKKGERPTDLPHDRDEVFVNNAKYVTDMMVGFTVGAPVSYTAAKENDIEPVLNALDAMRIKKHDKELEKGLSAMGVGYELHYLSIKTGTVDETIPKVAWIDPRGMMLVVDDTVDRNKLFAIRPVEKQNLKREKFWEVQVYTSKGIIYYKSKSKKLSEADALGKPSFKEHFYGEVPVIEFRNNEEKQGDYEQQLSQIDKYNLLQTDRIQDKENFIKAIMILYGFSLPDDAEKSSSGNVILEAPSKDLGANAEYVTNTFQESEVQTLADSLLSDFHKTTYVPNLNDEQFAGNISGEAMKYKLFGLLLILATKIGYLEDGIFERLRLIQNILNVKGHNVDVEGTVIKFKPNLPIDRSNVIQQIRDSQEFIPLLISLGWLDDIDDPAEVLEMLDEQKEKNIELQAKVMGVQADDSHSDLDGPPEEGDNDQSNVQKE
ncbi:phage portal protein [Enterococcus hulanensis]|uniref:phage portal protein n=1 Tax=Enterococcus TaxID=1350 RepID=UPI000B5A3468|nr:MULTISPECIES: phage portal protein [Enterococcus]MBO0413213.1 phage portal protein [Enterococcus hulanensis]OTO15120.1 SPP1 family phage portal protein [Enterococcus sp. 3H8_DIV0648]